MAYLMEEVNVLKHDNKIKTYSLLVKNNKISFMKDCNQSIENYFSMNLSHYILTPGHVMVDFNMQTMDFSQFKTYITNKLINRGCTTLMSVFSIENEREFHDRLKEARARLLNSPIDYYLALQLPLEKLTPSIVRKCKRNKIPAIFIEIENVEVFKTHPWGWIRDALYQFPLAFFPIYNGPKMKSFHKIWSEVLKEQNIAFVQACPKQHTPLTLDVLMKIGIYPSKGEIRIGGELDYNLYTCPEGMILETASELDYDNQQPEITFHRGKILKAGKEVYFRPGFGNECKVTVPGHFQLQ